MSIAPCTTKLPSQNAAAPSPQRLTRSIALARDALLSRQHPDGYWVGELEGDSILESEYILLKFILGQEHDPDLPLIANYLRGLQRGHGGWSLYPGGQADLSATVKAYWALKLLGDDPEMPHMRRARAVCLQLGGAGRCNSFTRFYLAALGQISYDHCPTIPPEIVLLPRWFYFNLYSVSAWTRTMILPLAIVSAHRPVRSLRPDQGIQELFVAGVSPLSPPTVWGELFLAVDTALRLYNHLPQPGLRGRAMREAERWLLRHMAGSDGLGAIFPPMVYILIALRCLGYADDHPRVREAQAQLRALFLRQGNTIRIQPCHSPVWDTGIALHALADAGLTPDAEPARRASDWLLRKECRRGADWRINCPAVEPSGWYFEFANPHYPDTDDTAMVSMSLRQLGGPEARPAVERGTNWLLAMQNDDGGWAAFDRTRNRPILEHMPFADHNAMQDPSCPDITGRVLECLGTIGLTPAHPRVQAAIEFLRRRQEPDGSWFGRWGVNYIYGTWQVLVGLQAIGEPMGKSIVSRAAAWLRNIQKSDGSFGESCASYERPDLKCNGPSTPSQTAWGAMGLLAACGPGEPAVQRAMQWLIDNQRDDGNWDEEFCTGTGFPRVFYLKYHLYRLYFPLMALARYARLRDG